MTKRGPKPDSAAVKTAKGNPSRRPIGHDPRENLAVPVMRVDPPTWLKNEGLRVWKRLAPKLYGIKILTVVDSETFARYCNNFGRWIKLQRNIQKEGEYYDTGTGFARPHPAMMIVLRLEPVLERAEDRFGLNPSERQRLFAARAQGSSQDLFSSETSNNKEPEVKQQVSLEDAPAIGALN